MATRATTHEHPQHEACRAWAGPTRPLARELAESAPNRAMTPRRPTTPATPSLTPLEKCCEPEATYRRNPQNRGSRAGPGIRISRAAIRAERAGRTGRPEAAWAPRKTRRRLAPFDLHRPGLLSVLELPHLGPHPHVEPLALDALAVGNRALEVVVVDLGGELGDRGDPLRSSDHRAPPVVGAFGPRRSAAPGSGP